MSAKRDILLGAQKVITEKGFVQGKGLMGPKALGLNGVCILEAFNAATLDLGISLGGRLVEDVKDELGALIPNDYRSDVEPSSSHWKIINWNDDPERTQEEVLALLGEAAEKVTSGDDS